MKVSLNTLKKVRLNDMQIFCRKYILLVKTSSPDAKGLWQKAAIETLHVLGHTKEEGSKKPGEKRSYELRKWVCKFILDCEEIPSCHWQTSGRLLINDPDFAQEIHAHLQSLKPSGNHW
jgi:hypothetical protein